MEEKPGSASCQMRNTSRLLLLQAQSFSVIETYLSGFMHFVNDRQCLFGIIASALLLTAITVRDLDRVSKEPKNVQFTFLRRSQFKDH